MFNCYAFTIINKSRQLGISTLVAGYSLWTMLFHKDKTVLCIATKQETAKGMVEKVQFMYNNLPGWLKGNQKPAHENTSLGTLRLDGIPPAPKGVPQIRVTFTINEDGFLFVSAQDLGTGKKIAITLW